MRMRNKNGARGKGELKDMIAHYTKTSVFLDNIHPRGHFRISSFSKLNDPYESKQRIFGLSDDYNPDDFSEKNFGDKSNKIVQLPKEATAVLLNKIKVGAFVYDSQNPSDIMQAQFWNNAPLWAHYGNKNKGLILILKKDKFLEAARKKAFDVNWAFASKPMNYENLRPQTNSIFNSRGIKIDDADCETKIARSLFKSHKHLWFHKDNKWQYESEYRVILFSKEDEYTLIPIQESLVAIILGADANKDDFDKINAFRKTSGYSLYKSKYDIFNLRYKIELVQ